MSPESPSTMVPRTSTPRLPIIAERSTRSDTFRVQFAPTRVLPQPRPEMTSHRRHMSEFGGGHCFARACLYGKPSCGSPSQPTYSSSPRKFLRSRGGRSQYQSSIFESWRRFISWTKRSLALSSQFAVSARISSADRLVIGVALLHAGDPPLPEAVAGGPERRLPHVAAERGEAGLVAVHLAPTAFLVEVV